MLQDNSGHLIELFLQLAKINALSGNEKPLADFHKKLSYQSWLSS